MPPRCSRPRSGDAMIRAETDGEALASNSGSTIRAYVEHINRLREERDARGADIAEVLAEAKGNGFNRKALKRLADHIAKPADKLAAADADEQEFDLYLSAYKSAGG